MRELVQVPSFMDRHRILGVKQAAEALGFSLPHLRRLYRTGKIPKPQAIGERKLGWPAGVIMDISAGKVT